MQTTRTYRAYAMDAELELHQIRRSRIHVFCFFGARRPEGGEEGIITILRVCEGGNQGIAERGGFAIRRRDVRVCCSEVGGIGEVMAQIAVNAGKETFMFKSRLALPTAKPQALFSAPIGGVAKRLKHVPRGTLSLFECTQELGKTCPRAAPNISSED